MAGRSTEQNQSHNVQCYCFNVPATIYIFGTFRCNTVLSLLSFPASNLWIHRFDSLQSCFFLQIFRLAKVIVRLHQLA